MNCSVIIVNYNTGDLLKRAVECVLAQSKATEIIIVDNFSHDSSMAELNNDERIKKYYRKKNYGFASSCNYGASRATCENLLFLNPDCLMPEKSLSPLLENLANREVGMVGCHITNSDGSEQRASRRRLPTFWRALKTFSGLEKLARVCDCFAGVNLNHRTVPSKPTSVEAISGALMLLKKSTFNEVGGFDEEYPMHFEDLDLMKRLLNANYQIIYNPLVSAVHYQGTSSQHNPKVEQMKKQGLIRYFEKHQSLPATALIKRLTKVF